MAVRCCLLVALCLIVAVAECGGSRHDDSGWSPMEAEYPDGSDAESCLCGVFMSQQVGLKEGRRGRPRGPPKGDPIIIYDTEEASLPCGAVGNKICTNKCLDEILKHLSKSGPAICGAAERDINREHAFMFIKNCGSEWTPTKFSAGKEFCCTAGEPHECE